jgi:hypothetical protein
MNSATLLIAVPAVIGVVFLLNKALAYLVRRKYEQMLHRQYCKGVYDSKREQGVLVTQLRGRVWSLEDQVRRLRQPASNGVRP